MRVQYLKEFPTLRQANDLIFGLNLVRFPAQKVFDQPVGGSKNGVDIGFRFEDDETFTTLRIKAEGLIYKREVRPEFPEDAAVSFEKNRVMIEFDKGSLKSMKANNFNPEEWLKGYFHVLRRDLEKVISGAS